MAVINTTLMIKDNLARLRSYSLGSRISSGYGFRVGIPKEIQIVPLSLTITH